MVLSLSGTSGGQIGGLELDRRRNVAANPAGANNSWRSSTDFALQAFGAPHFAGKGFNNPIASNVALAKVKSGSGSQLNRGPEHVQNGASGNTDGIGSKGGADVGGVGEDGKKKNMKDILTKAVQQMNARPGGGFCPPSVPASLLDGLTLGERNESYTGGRGRGRGIIEERTKLLFPDGHFGSGRRGLRSKVKNTKQVESGEEERGEEGGTPVRRKGSVSRAAPHPSSPPKRKSSQLPQVGAHRSSSGSCSGANDGGNQEDASASETAGGDGGEVLASTGYLGSEQETAGGRGGATTPQNASQRRQEAAQLFLHDHRQKKGLSTTSPTSTGAGPYTVGHIPSRTNPGKGKEVSSSSSNNSNSPHSKGRKSPEQKSNPPSSPIKSRMSLQMNTSFNGSFRLRNNNSRLGNHPNTTTTSGSPTKNSIRRRSTSRLTSTSPRREGRAGGSGRGNTMEPSASSPLKASNTSLSNSYLSSLSFSGSIRQDTEKANLLSLAREAVASTLAESAEVDKEEMANHYNDHQMHNPNYQSHDRPTDLASSPGINAIQSEETSGNDQASMNWLHPTDGTTFPKTSSSYPMDSTQRASSDISPSSTSSPGVVYPSIYPSGKGTEMMNAVEHPSAQNLPLQNNSGYPSSSYASSSSSSQMPGIHKTNGGPNGNMSRSTGNSSSGAGGGGSGNENYDFQVLFSYGKAASRPIELSVGVGWTQGMRPTMEDEHFCKLHSRVVRDQPVSFLGILDGHCGKRVAELGARYLPDMFFSHHAIGDNNALAMVESILQADHSIYQTLSGKPEGGTSWFGSLLGGKTSSSAYGGYNSRFTEATPSGGSTLICAAIHGRMLYVACLGDARAVLLDGKTTIPMSEDHKPGNTKEIQRIQRCGGFVQFGRVCGVLAVSRALGDFEFKNTSGGGREVSGYGGQRGNSGKNVFAFNREPGSLLTRGPLTPSEYMVSNVADVRQLALTDDSKFLILACDGLWDVVSNEEATQFVQDFLSYTPEVNDLLVLHGKRPKPPSSVIHRVLCNCSQKLAEFAVDRGSTDNVSVMVLFFHDVIETVVGFSQLHQLSIPAPFSDGVNPQYGSPVFRRRKKKKSTTGFDNFFSPSGSLTSFSSPLQGYIGGMPTESSSSTFSLPTPGHPNRRSLAGVGGGGGVNDLRSPVGHSLHNSTLLGNSSSSGGSSGSRGWLPSPHLLRNTPSSVAEVGGGSLSTANQGRNAKGTFPAGYNHRTRALR